MPTTTVEHDIVALVYAAKEDSDAADQFIQQYLPFIRIFHHHA